MLSILHNKRAKMRDTRDSLGCLIRPMRLGVAVFFCIVGLSFRSVLIGSAGVEIPEGGLSGETAGGAVSREDIILAFGGAEDSGRQREESNVAEVASELICQGNFEAAKQLIEEQSRTGGGAGEQVSCLTEILKEYEEIRQRRQSERESVYEERLEKLAKLESGERDGNDVNDVNEQDRVSAVLSAVARAWKFADSEQKRELLSKEFVQEAIGEAKAEAAEHESRGEWLEAYLVCWSWLAAVEPNNKGYAEHADELAEKAEIAGAFQDSPCETASERFENVKKRMFIRAIDALNFNYVSKIDYLDMALKGLRRCRSLAEVVRTKNQISKRENQKANREIAGKRSEDFSAGEGFIENHGQDARATEAELLSLSSGLSAILAELEGLKALRGQAGLSKERFISVFEQVLELNSRTAALPEQIVVAQFSVGSLSALDPYTVMVWPRQVKDFEKLMTNEFTGIGIEINKQKGRLTVASLLPDTPAYNSGLDAEDVIEKVDGKATKDMSLSCAVKHITGPAGTKVTLTIRRPGEEKTEDITITRARIVVRTIRGWQRREEGKWLYMIDAKMRIGYVRITDFSEKTAWDLEKVLKNLEAAGMRGLILDMRFNTGGYLESAIEVADKFLSEGLVVMTRPRFGMPTYAVANKKGTHPNYPIVVLINGVSASASEIVAGALGDMSHRRAILVGERTYGKGLVQGITHYPGDGAQLKYTMANYYLPSGQKVKSRDEAKKAGGKDWGVGPMVEVKLRGDEVRKMLDVQRDNAVLVKAGHTNNAGSLKKHSIEDTIEADSQLSIGILVLKSKLIAEEAREQKRKAA